MRYMIVETRSGARYRVFPHGKVERAGASIEMENVRHQYVEGYLGSQTMSDLVFGGRIHWFGVGPDSTESIVSSVIERMEWVEVEG